MIIAYRYLESAAAAGAAAVYDTPGEREQGYHTPDPTATAASLTHVRGFVPCIFT